MTGSFGKHLKQAEAICVISNFVLPRTQRMVFCKADTAAIEPDRLESRYAAVSDVANVATTAGKIVEQADSLCINVDPTQGLEMLVEKKCIT